MVDTTSNTELVLIDKDFVDRNRQNGWPDLPDVGRAFAHAYITNGYNHREAAKACGISPDRGISLKRDPLISAFIKNLQDQTFTTELTTKQFLDAKLDHLEEIALGEREIPIVTASGQRILAKKFHPDLAMNIIKQRSALGGFIKEDKGKSGDVNIQINVDAMTGKAEIKNV